MPTQHPHSLQGLDAAAALDIVRSLRLTARVFGGCVIATQTQASEEMVLLYDHVCLMSKGRCIYYGPPTQALPYFEQNGFLCPPRRTFPDFLSSIADGTVAQDKQYTASADEALATHYVVMKPRGLTLFEEPSTSSQALRNGFLRQGSLIGVSQTLVVGDMLLLRTQGGWACAGPADNPLHAEPVRTWQYVMYGGHAEHNALNGVYALESSAGHNSRPVYCVSSTMPGWVRGS
jgi:hypothetical protein